MSGEHRLPAYPFRQAAEKLFERSIIRSSFNVWKSSASCRRQQASGLCSPEREIRVSSLTHFLRRLRYIGNLGRIAFFLRCIFEL